MRHIIAIILAHAVNDRIRTPMTKFGTFQQKGCPYIYISSQIGLFMRPFSVKS